ncbi:LysE family translocator [Desulfotalea psychrophila]|uniref:Related to putative threonine efflux protein n=1 Tax=Desulfotalea psychrophila (strain LSv54 / DSM 12343) TaxID=177439 RepID=Q6APG3_DESPS|nr:LysE family translocator [Desulfotalea psychrophila]CAG35761.1 related to putative threonine efflux protein [Desulfotalea psychrophila LSv54]
MNLSLLSLFVPTFIIVSATPGMCMTLSMTLGMTIGVRRTLWMMAGELVGVGLVAIAAVVGVASIMLRYPSVFMVLKYIGATYLCWLGIQLWRSCGRMAVHEFGDGGQASSGRKELVVQGFVTAVANPKGWAFFVSLLPPFIDASQPLTLQLSMLVSFILIIEFCFLLFYAQGGKTLRKFLQKRGNVQRINRLAGVMMVAVGFWLALG